MEKYGKLTDQDFCEFSNKIYEKGVLTLKIKSLDEFKDVTKKFDDKTDYIFRGQRCYLTKRSFDSASFVLLFFFTCLSSFNARLRAYITLFSV